MKTWRMSAAQKVAMVAVVVGVVAVSATPAGGSDTHWQVVAASSTWNPGDTHW